jgi:hypothetical protein
MTTYTTGTAIFTAGSTAVTGSGTVWNAAMVGAQIVRNGLVGHVAAIVSPTSLTLAQVAPAGMAGTGSYAIDLNTSDAATGAAILPKVDDMLSRLTQVTVDRGAESEAMYDSDMAVYLGGRDGDPEQVIMRNLELMKRWASEGK